LDFQPPELSLNSPVEKLVQLRWNAPPQSSGKSGIANSNVYQRNDLTMIRKYTVLALLVSLASCSNEKLLIKQYVAKELTNYPESRLTDLYKNYFQDAFGPGHLIPDTLSAAAYLDWELSQIDYQDTVRFQELGIHHDFIRINLNLVRKGIIPRSVMLQAMVISSPLARKPDLISWIKEWRKTASAIRKIKPDLPGFDEDSLKIEQMLDKGEVTMHHSANFSAQYHPHYRIIHRSVFEVWKESYLKEFF